MTSPADQEFYVGYADRAPRGIGRFVRRAVALLLVGGLGVALAGALAQKAFDVASFEYGLPRSFRGQVSLDPYPTLLVRRPGQIDPHNRASRVSAYLLVAGGKHGAGPALAPFEAQVVDLDGTLIYRDDQTMIEVDPGSLAPDGESLPPEMATELGRVTLRGEVVDSKCFLGVMKPGELVPHRACAVRCLSGGIPPMLVVRDSLGVAGYVLLAADDGQPIGHVLLDLVAVPVEVTGRLERRNGHLVLYANRSDYRRI